MSVLLTIVPGRPRIDESELEEGSEVGGPVSARARAKGSKPDSRLVSGERLQQSARHAQMQHITEVDASYAEDATIQKSKSVAIATKQKQMRFQLSCELSVTSGCRSEGESLSHSRAAAD